MDPLLLSLKKISRLTIYTANYACNNLSQDSRQWLLSVSLAQMSYYMIRRYLLTILKLSGKGDKSHDQRFNKARERGQSRSASRLGIVYQRTKLIKYALWIYHTTFSRFAVSTDKSNLNQTKTHRLIIVVIQGMSSGRSRCLSGFCLIYQWECPQFVISIIS